MGKLSSERQGYDKEVYKFSVQEALQILQTNKESGLTTLEVQTRQKKYGPNQLEGYGSVKWYSLLLKQVSNAMILVLILAMALSYGVTDYIEGGVITAVIILNVVIGFYQEFQAEKKMDSLRSLASPSARVIRDGRADTVPSGDVVPGDIVEIKMGDTVPADLRLFDVMNLAVDDAILTGESKPNSKHADEYTPKLDQNGNEIPLVAADCKNLAHSSTTVTKGRAKGIVVFSSMYTEIGRIAGSMTGKKRKPNRSMSRKKHGTLQPAKGAALRFWDSVGNFLGLTKGTPLQIKLSMLAYVLFGCALVLAIIVFSVNSFNVTNEVAIYAISTGIAIIPESLVAVLTITMLVGMTQMRKRRVVVRQLSALEALGGITNICSDKTGTLTKGKMVAYKTWIPGIGIYTIDRSGHPFQTTGTNVSLVPAPKSKSETTAEREQEKSGRDAQRSPAGFQFNVPGEKYEKDKQKAADGQAETLENRQDNNFDIPKIVPELEAFLKSAALCNLATIKQDLQNQEWKTTGDPTEVALQVLAHRFGLGKPSLQESGWRQLAEYPFDSKVKMMSVIYQKDTSEEYIQFTKGASERVIEFCDHVGVGAHEEQMTEEKKRNILDMMESLTEQGLRVLAIARKKSSREAVDANNAEQPETFNEWTEDAKTEWEEDRDRVRPLQIECNLTLLGFAGLYDPPRDETTDAVRACTRAGIKVHMLTGDHPSTATAIAKEVGIIPRNPGTTLGTKYTNSIVKTAAEFESMTDDQIDAMPTLPFVIARCAPATKTRMIQALHRRGLFCAMTGDGVNDGPSLQAANVGIAMGMAGSDVAKSASDILLTDDNFASIVNAIEEGRRMFDNIQKFILHLLTSNVGEVILLVVGLAFRDSNGFSVFPLSPLQILWINMLTSSFPAFGLGREKAACDILRRPPHDSHKGVFTWQIIIDMLVYGSIAGTLCLLTFIIIIYGPGPDTLGQDCNAHYSESCNTVFRARAAVFAELTWLILISAWEFKSLRNSLFNLEPTRSADPEDKSKGPKPKLDGNSSVFPFTFFASLWENTFLFFSVVLGAISVIPAVYIPGLNHTVFKHAPISWEWGLSVGAVIIFIAGVEFWKWVKRTTGWFSDRESSDRTSRQGMWSFARTFSRTISGASSFGKTRMRTEVEEDGLPRVEMRTMEV